MHKKINIQNNKICATIKKQGYKEEGLIFEKGYFSKRGGGANKR
jgi:hypothetical protein